MTFDPTKPAQTRAGTPVRIICTDRKSEFSIVVLVEERGKEVVGHRRADGTGCHGAAYDLVNIPVVDVRYVNLKTAQLFITFNGVGVISGGVRTVDRAFDGYSTVKLTFHDGVLISSEVVR